MQLGCLLRAFCVISPPLQIFETEYPGETMVLSAEEKVLNEVRYYVGLVCRAETSAGSEGVHPADVSSLSGGSGSDGEGGGLSEEEHKEMMAEYNNADSVFVIALSDLMAFEKLQAACHNDVSYLRLSDGCCCFALV